MKRATWPLLPGGRGVLRDETQFLDPVVTTRGAGGARSRPRWWTRVQLSPSSKVYLGLMAYLAGVKLTLSLFPAIFRSPAQAAVFSWPLLPIWAATGLLGIELARRTSFPEAWGGRGSNRQRLLVPALLGLGLGLLAVATDLQTNWADLAAAKHGLASIHIDFPASAIVYPGGAVIVEVLYRLLPLPLLLWLSSSLALRGRGREQAFWALAILLSLVEPLSQDLSLQEFGTGVMAAVFVQDYALNLSQAALFRRYGFLSAIALRVVFYLVWHVAYGNFLA
jgi:hypothetical protein